MIYYFCDLSFRILFLKLKGNQVHLFNRDATVSIFIKALGRIPFIKNKLDNLVGEPDIYIGNYKGLYYRINKEAMECTDFVYNRLKLEDCQFTKVYNEKFKTNKFKPFVLKWVSIYVLELLSCLYRTQLDNPSQKILYLHDNPLNRHIYEWWSKKTENKIQTKWLKRSEARAGLEAIISIPLIFTYTFLSRGLCLPVKPRKFKIMREAVWGLRNPTCQDDFFIDDKRLLKKDLLLYTTGSEEPARKLAYKDAQESEYECMNINKLRIPLNLPYQRLLKYHFLLPLVFILKDFRNKQSYLLKDWLIVFHATAINYEILLSHYQIGLELSNNETGLSHIPETIILNNYGAKSAIFHWSDLTLVNYLIHHFKSHNLYLIWGKRHCDFYRKHYFIDKVIETGCWLKYDFNEATEIGKIYRKLKLPINSHTVLAFYDDHFAIDSHFTEEILLDFWQMMFELIDQRKDAIGILKPKLGTENQYRRMSDKGKETFNNIKQMCSESGRFYFIDNPREVGVTEVIAISSINISMGMGSPSTIALLSGKVGLYYDTTGSDCYPFAKEYKNKLVFDNKRDLFSAVNRIIDDGYNPLNKINEELLRDNDYLRDNMGVERFKKALLENL